MPYVKPRAYSFFLWNLYYILKNDCKVEKILKSSLDSIPSPSPSVKIQIMGGKVCLRCKGKTLLGVFLFSKVCWQRQVNFCLYNPTKLSCPYFEFSQKVKVMGLNPGYFLKSFLLWQEEALEETKSKINICPDQRGNW